MMASFSSDLPPVFSISKDKTFRSSHLQMMFNVNVLRNFAVSQENTSVGVSLYIIKKLPQNLHWPFPVEFAKFFRTPVLKIICEHVPLNIID